MKNYNYYKACYPNYTDAEIIETLSKELSDKVSAIGRLLDEIEALKSCEEKCDCQDYEKGLVSNYCNVHNENPLKIESQIE